MYSTSFVGTKKPRKKRNREILRCLPYSLIYHLTLKSNGLFISWPKNPSGWSKRKLNLSSGTLIRCIYSIIPIPIFDFTFGSSDCLSLWFLKSLKEIDTFTFGKKNALWSFLSRRCHVKIPLGSSILLVIVLYCWCLFFSCNFKRF